MRVCLCGQRTCACMSFSKIPQPERGTVGGGGSDWLLLSVGYDDPRAAHRDIVQLCEDAYQNVSGSARTWRLKHSMRQTPCTPTIHRHRPPSPIPCPPSAESIAPAHTAINSQPRAWMYAADTDRRLAQQHVLRTRPPPHHRWHPVTVRPKQFVGSRGQMMVRVAEEQREEERSKQLRAALVSTYRLCSQALRHPACHSITFTAAELSLPCQCSSHRKHHTPHSLTMQRQERRDNQEQHQQAMEEEERPRTEPRERSECMRACVRGFEGCPTTARLRMQPCNHVMVSLQHVRLPMRG